MHKLLVYAGDKSKFDKLGIEIRIRKLYSIPSVMKTGHPHIEWRSVQETHSFPSK